MLRIIFIQVFIFWGSLGSFAQPIAPTGFFLKDSVKIGEPVSFSLSIKYPKKLEIIFPDSTHNFEPFELISKNYFTTTSDSIFSYDSAIYHLTTFEIDSVQYLKVPIYIINEFDSTIIYTNIDSIILNQVVIEIPDSVAMVTNTKYVDVPMAFNYPYATIGAFSVLIIVGILWFFFGAKIKSKIKVFRLKKQHLAFIQNFENLVSTNRLDAESILTLWKSYLEKLKKEPFTKLTTKEVSYMLKRHSLNEALISIDKNIYGPKDESLLDDAYAIIKDLAIEEYTAKVNHTTHG